MLLVNTPPAVSVVLGGLEVVGVVVGVFAGTCDVNATLSVGVGAVSVATATLCVTGLGVIIAVLVLCTSD